MKTNNNTSALENKNGGKKNNAENNLQTITKEIVDCTLSWNNDEESWDKYLSDKTNVNCSFR